MIKLQKKVSKLPGKQNFPFEPPSPILPLPTPPPRPGIYFRFALMVLQKWPSSLIYSKEILLVKRVRFAYKQVGENSMSAIWGKSVELPTVL